MNQPLAQPYIDHPAQARPGIKVFPDKLYVVTTVSNPMRYRVRYELYRQFEKHMQESGAKLITVEMAFGGREFEVTSASNPDHVQVRGDDVLWYKENLTNIGFQHMPADWKYAAWIDADAKFVREDWVQETLHQLQHHHVVQMWSHLQDIGPNFEPIPTIAQNSWGYNWVNGKPPIKMADVKVMQKTGVYPYPGTYQYKGVQKVNKGWYGPPGLAWAIRREAFDALGGLIDWAIVGSGDAYMAAALIGGVQYWLRKDYSPEFNRRFLLWQNLAERHIRRDIGVVDGLVLHYWHGPKKNRQYIDRNTIMSKYQFNPTEDLKKDWQGLWQLVDHGDERSMRLRDDLRLYFKQRNEDSTEV
jgi:hypothetical protein